MNSYKTHYISVYQQVQHHTSIMYKSQHTELSDIVRGGRGAVRASNHGASVNRRLSVLFLHNATVDLMCHAREDCTEG